MRSQVAVSVLTLLASASMGLCAGDLAQAAPWDYRTKIEDGFEGSDFAHSCGLYYRQSKEQAAEGYAFQSDMVRDGKRALKLTVTPKCRPDEENCSERAEVWEKTASRVPFDKGVWYGISVRFQAPMPKLHHRFVFAQWKRESGSTRMQAISPYLALRMKHGKIYATVETNAYPAQKSTKAGSLAECTAGDAPVWLRPHEGQMRALVAYEDGFQPKVGARFAACSNRIKITTYGHSMPSATSGWIDFAVYSKPGADGDGHLELFANGLHLATIRGHISQKAEGLGPNQYFKFGLYRDPAPRSWTVFYDNFVRSADCMDVLKSEALCSSIKY
ncbi:hypothetical protein FDK21_18855 [Cohaesibacter sp. CAU 1516]|uniref:polysaccharide lyase n=1 Tax=Cohaesibacter sp. CAU 1516 TaxID=2576038 RepID=UPI0010FDE80E|nr:polysaccharide lyase [Cohaesibacter sp. CAU 1516]TLP42888.1 hypothetical protein FDK21_18855 [Cohaesibacter sp. CAU 1516]